jgi:menaquinone-dependent protoporphyrinogen IX oxidase
MNLNPTNGEPQVGGTSVKRRKITNFQAESLKMKGIVVYDTSYGNTKTIAETISETLKESGIEVDLFHVKDVKKLTAKDYDFLVLGSPTRFGTMSFAIRGFLGKVKSEEWANKPFAAFDTENPENMKKKEWSAAEKIAARLIDKKMNQLSPVLKALVLGQKGPPKEGEIERAKEYAMSLAAKLKE